MRPKAGLPPTDGSMRWITAPGRACAARSQGRIRRWNTFSWGCGSGMGSICPAMSASPGRRLMGGPPLAISASDRNGRSRRRSPARDRGRAPAAQRHPAGLARIADRLRRSGAPSTGRDRRATHTGPSRRPRPVPACDRGAPPSTAPPTDRPPAPCIGILAAAVTGAALFPGRRCRVLFRELLGLADRQPLLNDVRASAAASGAVMSARAWPADRRPSRR